MDLHLSQPCRWYAKTSLRRTCESGRVTRGALGRSRALRTGRDFFTPVGRVKMQSQLGARPVSVLGGQISLR